MCNVEYNSQECHSTFEINTLAFECHQSDLNCTLLSNQFSALLRNICTQSSPLKEGVN